MDRTRVAATIGAAHRQMPLGRCGARPLSRCVSTARIDRPAATRTSLGTAMLQFLLTASRANARVRRSSMKPFTSHECARAEGTVMHVPVRSRDTGPGLRRVRGTRHDRPAPVAALKAGAQITRASVSSIATATSAGRSSRAPLRLRAVSLVQRRFVLYSWARSRHLDGRF